MEEEIVLMEENDIEEINIEEENYSGKPYTLPIASTDTLGGIKVGENLTIDEDGTLNAQAGGSGSVIGEDNQMFSVKLSSQYDAILSKEWETHKINFDTKLAQIGKNLSLTDDGKIKIGKGITKISLQASVLIGAWTNLGEIDLRLILTRNGKDIRIGQVYSELKTLKSFNTIINIFPLFDVQENDEVYLAFTSNVSGTFRLSHVGTFLTIEKINETNVISGGEVDLSGYATKDDLFNKVDKVTGKSLISDTEITRLASVTNYDDTEIKNTLKTKADTSAIPTKVSQLSNDKGYLTSVPSEYITETELNSKGYLTKHQDISNLATKDELHSHSNKSVLDNITSNKVTSWDNKSTFSGSYNDLTNKPTIPTVPTNISSFTNDSGYLTSIPSEYVTETELNEVISNIGGGNVSSNTVNSIMVVDALPEIEVEGVLYLVKESEIIEPELINLYPSQIEHTEEDGFAITFKEQNVIVNGSNNSSSVWGWTNKFTMNLEANKTYYLQLTNISGSFDDSKRVSESDGVVTNVSLSAYNSSGTETQLISQVERPANGIYEKYTFTPTIEYAQYSVSLQVKKYNSFNNWTCSIVIAEEK